MDKIKMPENGRHEEEIKKYFSGYRLHGYLSPSPRRAGGRLHKKGMTQKGHPPSK
jgi:hypothetical protein